jgi:hypothetical protein
MVTSLALLTIGFTKRLKQIQWGYCPQTPAKIKTAQVFGVFGRRKCFGVVICYDYSSEGKQYTGRCRRVFRTEAAANAFVSECRARELMAGYKPETPHESRLFVSSPIKPVQTREHIVIDLSEAFLCCDCEAICNSANSCSRCQSDAVISVARIVPHHRDAIRIILSADRKDALAA